MSSPSSAKNRVQRVARTAMAVMAFGLVFAAASVAMAQEGGTAAPTAKPAASISGDQFVRAAALLGAGLCMGLGAIGPGIGEGFAAGKACEGVSRAPDQANLLTRTMLIGQAVSESTGIYSLVVALLLMFL
jgi:F-type H+-transporting ATPase subunit c